MEKMLSSHPYILSSKKDKTVLRWFKIQLTILIKGGQITDRKYEKKQPSKTQPFIHSTAAIMASTYNHKSSFQATFSYFNHQTTQLMLCNPGEANMKGKMTTTNTNSGASYYCRQRISHVRRFEEFLQNFPSGIMKLIEENDAEKTRIVSC